MADTDWTRIAIEAGGWAASSMFGLVIGAWRGGRHSVHKEQKIKDDYDRKIEALRDQTRLSMAEYEKQADARNDLLIEQFKESFDGLRRQMDDHKLDTERRFLPRDDFRDFREEWREDMKRIFDKLDQRLKQ